MGTSAKLNDFGLSLFGFNISWVPDRTQQTAAWELYVELVTRIAVERLHADEGLMRGALSSLYAVFGETRKILRAHGPALAIRPPKSNISFGEIAIAVINEWLRPFLAKWHRLLAAYESELPPGTSADQHERNWDKAAALRSDLEDLQNRLILYADALAEVCGIAPIHRKPQSKPV